jgi:hypothetical protein
MNISELFPLGVAFITPEFVERTKARRSVEQLLRTALLDDLDDSIRQRERSDKPCVHCASRHGHKHDCQVFTQSLPEGYVPSFSAADAIAAHGLGVTL